MLTIILLLAALILFVGAAVGRSGRPSIYRLEAIAAGLACVVASMLVPLL